MAMPIETMSAFEEELQMEVMANSDTLDEIIAGTRQHLQAIGDGELFNVHNTARNLADAIRFEFEFQDNDMAIVVAKQSAMLELLIVWLTEHGVDCRALRERKPTTKSRQWVAKALATTHRKDSNHD